MAQVGPFSDYLVGYLNLFKQQAGFDLYALSPQNEPVGPTSYNSCGYTAADYTALLLTLCPKMRAAGLSTRVYFADDIFGNFGGITAPTAGAIRSDTVTSNVASILSDHYSGGSDASSRPEYRSMGGAAKTMGKEAWNTEFGNGSDDWNGGAWANVRDMYSMLSLGYSGIVYWLLGPHTNASQADESVMYSLTPGPKARAIQAFARTIRPGAVRVRSVSTDSNNVRALAFRHDAQSKICVVLINNSSSQQTVSLAGSGLPASFSVNLTSPTSNYASMASAGPGNNINLPVKGILCLVGTAALSAERPSAPLLAAGVASVKAVRTYSLDGKLIRNTPSSRNAGAYCTVVRDDAGRATIHAQAGSWGGDR
jgi:O-glycosyl hydrolase